ncbi:MAG: DUF3325 family protein [Pseudomonadota bacterium]
MIIGLLTALGAMMCLAVSQNKHARTMFARPLPQLVRRVLQSLGGLLLLVSAWAGAQSYGVGIGLTAFCAWVCLAAWMVALILSWRQR